MRYLLIALSCLIAVRASAAAPFLEDIRGGAEATIVTMGTSLTDEPPSAWVSQLTTWLRSEAPNSENVTVFNEGVSAASSDNANFSLSGLDRQLPATLGRNPDVVFIEFAINDAYLPFGVSQAESVSNLNTMIDQLTAQNPDVEVVLQTMNNPIGVHLTTRPEIAEYYQGYRNVAADRGALLIDHYPVWLELYDDDPALWSEYVPDGIHPNAVGASTIIVPGIQAALETAVPEPGAVTMLIVLAAAAMRRSR